jgi:hypothetical protein
MKIMGFDLSSSCIGCVSVKTDDDARVVKIFTTPIIPPDYHSEKYLRSKKYLETNKGPLLSWAKPGEKKITKTEKHKRDVEVRNEKDLFILAYISREMDEIIGSVEPDLIIVEKNEIFNGILTSILLAKCMGSLQSIAGVRRIPIIEYRVNDVRAPYNVFKLVLSFADGKSADQLSSIPDVTKRAIRVMLEEKYQINFHTDDESDAALLIDYHLNYKT